MNLFILSTIPVECAMMMMDKHIVKIILEAVQMLCTAKKLLDPNDPICENLYKISHKNHPVSVWVRTSYENYIWTLDLVEAMHNEWRFRYNHPLNKFHKSYIVSLELRKNPPPIDKFEQHGLTPFVKAMPENFKLIEDPIEAYKQYYLSEEKQKFASWKKREKPNWYVIS